MSRGEGNRLIRIVLPGEDSNVGDASASARELGAG
jgi:hypothetical protein